MTTQRSKTYPTNILADVAVRAANVATKAGGVAVKTGDFAGALDWFNKACTVLESLTNSGYTNASRQGDVSVCYSRLGDVAEKAGDGALQAGKLDEARAWFKKANEIRQALVDNDPTNATWWRDLAVSYDKLGDVAAKTGKPDDAKGWFDKARAVRKGLTDKDPDNTTYQ